MVAFEVGIAILNHIADRPLVLLDNGGCWPPFEEPAEWTAQVLAFLKRSSLPQGLLTTRFADLGVAPCGR
jgi:hypothetical protein